MMFLAALVEERRRTDEESRRQQDDLAHAQRVAHAWGNSQHRSPTSSASRSQPSWPTLVAGRRMLDNDNRGSPPAVREILVDIHDGADRSARVLGRLRTLVRKASPERVNLDINTVIESGVGLLRATLREKQVTVRFARNEALARVLGDAVQLQQVVVNLVMNASEAVASATDDTARVIAIATAQPRSGRLRFSVTDSGIGVRDPADLEKIFERFVSTKPQGLGMGLTISRSIVEAHGGTIWAVANARRGLTVHVELPTLGALTTPNEEPCTPASGSLLQTSAR